MNEQNLTHKLTVSEARKGGQNSVKSRRQKKAIRDILNDYLDKDIQGNAQYEQIAKKLGIDDTKSIKDVFAIACVMNTLKKANLDDLEKMQRLLGEDGVKEENNGILNELTEYLKGDM